MALGLAKTSPMDIFLTYQFIRRLTKPFTEWKAFRLGVIDADGKILVKPEDRTPEQAESLKMFDMLILRLKKMLAKVPGGSSRLATAAAAWLLVKESTSTVANATDDQLASLFESTLAAIDADDVTLIEGYVAQRDIYSVLIEDAPVNNVSAGNIAGAAGDPPRPAWRKRFGKAEVFVVDEERFRRARLGKARYHRYETYVGDDEIGNAIRDYGRTNPSHPIVLENEKDGSMMFLKRGSYR